jgi:hypothetical protein
MTDEVEFDLWLETELWMEHGGDPHQPANRPTENFCNVVVTLQDGRRYALNVWTFDFVPLARLDWPYAYDATKQQPLAPYLLPPDLLVARLDRDTLHGIIKTMLMRGEMKSEWLSEHDAD